MSNEPIYHFHEEAATATINKLQAAAAAQHSANRLVTARAIGIGAIGISTALGILAVSCAFAYHIYLKKPIIVTEYVKQKQVITTTVEVPVTKVQKVNNDVVVTKVQKVNNDVVVTKVQKVNNDVAVTKVEKPKTVIAKEVIKDGNPTGYYKAGDIQTRGNMYAKYHSEVGGWGIEGWIRTNVQYPDVPTTITYRNGKTSQENDRFNSPDLLTYTYIHAPGPDGGTAKESNEPVSVTYLVNGTKYVFPVVVTKKLKGRQRVF